MQAHAWRQRFGEAVWVVVIGLGVVLLLYAAWWGVGAVLGTYDGSQDHRTFGGGKGNPKRSQIEERLLTRAHG